MKGFIRIAIASQHEKNLRCGRLQRTFAKPFEGARCWRKMIIGTNPKHVIIFFSGAEIA